MTKEEKEKYKKKILEIMGSAGWTASVFSLTALLTDLTSSEDFLKYYTAALILGTPVTYGTGKIIEKEIKNRRIKKKSHDNQLLLMKTQMLEPDYQITSIQTIFLNEINSGLKEIKKENKDYSFDEIMNINQFIYLINSNYYEKIKEVSQNMSREKLVRLLVSQISRYYSNKEEIIFNDNSAQEILNTCFFINEKHKKEIYNELKKSKIKNHRKTHYAVVRNDISPTTRAYKEKNELERQFKATAFNINEIGWYLVVIDLIAKDEDMQEYYGPCNLLKWDTMFLQKVIKLIATKYKEELIERNENYTNFSLTATLVEKATSYAMVNNRRGVGKEEILNAFRHWDYVPFDIQMSALDDIFVLEDLDYSMHPYKVKEKQKPKTKIIKYEEYKTKTTGL